MTKHIILSHFIKFWYKPVENSDVTCRTKLSYHQQGGITTLWGIVTRLRKLHHPVGSIIGLYVDFGNSCNLVQWGGPLRQRCHGRQVDVNYLQWQDKCNSKKERSVTRSCFLIPCQPVNLSCFEIYLKSKIIIIFYILFTNAEKQLKITGQFNVFMNNW